MPRIYVASLADYNAGRLHGRWIEADQPAEDIMEEVRAMLAESKEQVAEEWAIHDHEGFGGWRPGEWESFKTVSMMAEMIEEHGEAFPAFVDAFGITDIEQAKSDFPDAFRGEWDTFLAYAEEYVEDTGMLSEVPENIRAYFDYEAFSRDLAYDYTVVASSGGVFVFDSNW